MLTQIHTKITQKSPPVLTMVGVLLVYFVINLSIAESAVTELVSSPPSPWIVLEGQTITFVWSYTLDGTIVLAKFSNVTGGGSVLIARNSGGTTTVLANFQPRIIADISVTRAEMTLLGVKMSDQGRYEFDITPSNSGTIQHSVELVVHFPAKITKIHESPEKTVQEGSTAQLVCEATGEPTPNITWARVFENGGVQDLLTVQGMNATYTIKNINTTEAGTYRCTANNGIGMSDNQELKVKVPHPPVVVSLPSEYKVELQQSVSLDCQAEGYPEPSFSWTPCDSTGNVCNQSKLYIQEVLDDSVYTCTVKNYLGMDSAQTNVFIAGKKINVMFVITSESCNNGKYNQLSMLSKRLSETISKIFVNESAYQDTDVRTVTCGSIIVDLTLTFSAVVKEAVVLSILKEAAKDGKLGEFSIEASSIKGTRPMKPTTSPTFDKTIPTEAKVEVCSECSCNCTILIAVVCTLVAIIIALIIYVVWLHRKEARSKERNEPDPLDEKGKHKTAVEMSNLEPNLTVPRQQASESSSRSQYMALDEERRSHDLPERPQTNTSQSSQYAPLHPSTRSWEIPRENVTIEKIIGKGAFGQVAKGTAVGLRGRSPKTQVAVKMLKAAAPESDRKDLLSELEVMKTLKPHPHVIKLLGCVTESEPLLVLIEYVPYGDLLGYLRKSRGLNDTYYKDPDIKPQTSLTSQQLMKFAWQIADGMSYLSSRSIIHRDLAARNVLVGEGETCKVTDFGMARDVQQENIYERKTKGRLPVKWTAYEALLYGKYATYSDVWSYGVLLYEIFTIGGSPYPRMDGRKIANLLQQGYRMPKPKHVGDELYEIMMMCWQEDPNERPAFADLRNKLKQMENQHKRLINMNTYDAQLYANVEDLVE